MSLADKMLSRETPACDIRSTCRKEADKKFFGDLFSADWEVLVFRRDEQSGKYDMFALCCDGAMPPLAA